MAIVRIADLLAAEQRLDEAQAELRRLDDPDTWSAHESLTREGFRQLNINTVDLERKEMFRERVDREYKNMMAVRKAFIEEATG